MQSYIANFIVYTLAMVGFICLTLFVYKKSISMPQSNLNKEYLKIENILKLSATKTVYIIKAGCERFLIAGDTANTTLLAKLDAENVPPVFEVENQQNQEVKIPQLKDIFNKFNRG